LTCEGDCEKDAGLWYPKYKSGHNGRGPVCWQYCPSSYKNDGATCLKPVKMVAKKSYGRDAGHLQRRNYRRIFFRYIRDHHNVNLAYGKPLTTDEKGFLAPLFPQRLIDKVRVVIKKRRTGFANYSYDNMSFEQDAYGFESSSGPINAYLGADNSRVAIYASCTD
jgi:hypothetical protein